MTVDPAALNALAGNHVLDKLLEHARENPSIPISMIFHPDIIPAPMVRAALVVAVQRLDDK